MALCILVTMATDMGNREVELTRRLFITDHPEEWPRLVEVASGQVWRLLTPVFVHLNLMHIVFNLLMFLTLAGQVESLRGTGRLLFLILVTGVISNLVQYYLGRTTLVGLWPVPHGSPFFGGLSGVVYGLVGYVWMKSRLEPEQGLHLSSETLVFALLWFFLCLFYLKNVANGAHAGGLVVGMVLGALPGLWRRWQPRES
jgi:GlpG protein